MREVLQYFISTDELDPQEEIEFRYLNWRGDEHTYVLRIESIEFGYYGGHSEPGNEEEWLMSGLNISRDGESRKNSPTAGWPRRTFRMSEMREVKKVSDG